MTLQRKLHLCFCSMKVNAVVSIMSIGWILYSFGPQRCKIYCTAHLTHGNINTIVVYLTSLVQMDKDNVPSMSLNLAAPPHKCF